ncbi:NELL2-interacting cell ontogeny regulator 1-like isoform X2 [Hyperolius riggenbachi]|uniref:NELL2-interacting cell ontogeny regulator 1-like isoform X2 n=1 Tax=Hyperolius riggenbachi TaxID=752182 RepID=UPI0035A3D49C
MINEEEILIMFSAAVIIVFLGLISGTSVATTLPKGMGGALPRQGNVIPAENRPCVDCHAFEFLERALQDINQATYNLDTQAEKLVLRTEDRGRCKCIE